MTIPTDRFLALPLVKENKTESGIFLSAKETKDNSTFKVVIVGDKAKYLKVGDTIQKYEQSKGIPIDYLGTKHYMFREEGDVKLVL